MVRLWLLCWSWVGSELKSVCIVKTDQALTHLVLRSKTTMAAAPADVVPLGSFAAPVFGIIIVSKGDASLFTLFDSAKSYLTPEDEVLVIVNGAAHEPAVRAIVADFVAKENPKWTITIEVSPISTTTAALRNQFQNAPTTCKRATHLHHLHNEWAYLPGALTEMRRVAKSHPSQDVILLQERGAVMDACGALLPHTRKWPEWAEAHEENRVAQAAAFFAAALSSLPSQRIHCYPWMKVVAQTANPQSWAKFGFDGATYHTMDVKPLLLSKCTTYDAQHRHWVIQFNNQAVGGMNALFGRDPQPGVPKKLTIVYWQLGELKRVEFQEGHAGDVRVNIGPL